MPRGTRKPHERKQANRQQQARERQATELEGKVHAEWRLRETPVEEVEQPTQPEIDTTDDNGGDEQP
jgi:hypothetical protein